MSNGHIKVHRTIMDSPIFASEKGLKIWIWLLCKATYKERHLPVKIGKGETVVALKRGELLFGRFKAEESLCIDGSTIYRWIKKMEEMEMIEVKSSSQYTIITICNYDKYQTLNDDAVAANEQPMNNQRTTDEQPMSNQRTTDEHKQERKERKERKESKEVKEVKNENDLLKISLPENAGVSGEATKQPSSSSPPPVAPPPPSPLEVFKAHMKAYPGDKGGSYEILYGKFTASCKRHGYKEAEEIEHLPGAIQAYIKSVNSRRATGFDGLKYKNASTWLNNACWREDYTITTPKREVTVV
jgi:hypothetical protein